MRTSEKEKKKKLPEALDRRQPFMNRVGRVGRWDSQKTLVPPRCSNRSRNSTCPRQSRIVTLLN